MSFSCNLKIPNNNKIFNAKLKVRVHQKPKPGLSGDVKKNTEIGTTIPIWGPQFRLSFDLKINSHVAGDKWGSSNILSFKGNGATRKCCNNGDRVPSISVNKRGYLIIASSVNEIGNYYFLHFIKVKNWYNILIEQIPVKGEVCVLCMKLSLKKKTIL